MSAHLNLIILADSFAMKCFFYFNTKIKVIRYLSVCVCLSVTKVLANHYGSPLQCSHRNYIPFFKVGTKTLGREFKPEKIVRIFFFLKLKLTIEGRSIPNSSVIRDLYPLVYIFQ